jgi:hypothetical protein
MTLKEKFETKRIIDTERKAESYAEKCEKIADDYAIEFAEWIDKEGYIRQPNLWISLDEKSGKTSKELLEIFKKEKGL